jgi:hypothetical protein
MGWVNRKRTANTETATFYSQYVGIFHSLCWNSEDEID